MSNDGRCIPDWADGDAYPKSYDDIYEVDWRWEFLRRYPKYRQAWERGTPDTDINYSVKITNIDRKPAPEDSEICRTVFKLTHLVDPWGLRRIANGPANMFSLGTGAVTINPPLPGAPRDRDFVMVGFDLSKPLKPQMDDAYSHLKFQQENLKNELVTFKNKKEKWPRHIRVIDAFDQGATPIDVYSRFAEEAAGGDEEKLDDWFRPKSQPDATAIAWHSSAVQAMEMAIRLL